MIKSLVKKGEYFDSVSLMIVGKDVAQMDFVQDATVVMATQENKSILKTPLIVTIKPVNISDPDV